MHSHVPHVPHTRVHTNAWQTLCDEVQAKRILETLASARAAAKAGSRRLPDGACDGRPVKALVYSTSRNDLLSVQEQLVAQGLGQENIAELVGRDLRSVKVVRANRSVGIATNKNTPSCIPPSLLYPVYSLPPYHLPKFSLPSSLSSCLFMLAFPFLSYLPGLG